MSSSNMPFLRPAISPASGVGCITTHATELLRAIIGEIDREAFVVLCLDVQQSVVAACFAGIGGRDNVLVTPREVLQLARSMGAHSIIVGHNHPSGDPTPSSNDLRFTDPLVAAGVAFDIPVIDHIIIGADSYISLI